MQCLQQQGRRSCRPRQQQARRSSRKSRASRAAAKMPDSGGEQNPSTKWVHPSPPSKKKLAKKGWKLQPKGLNEHSRKNDRPIVPQSRALLPGIFLKSKVERWPGDVKQKATKIQKNKKCPKGKPSYIFYTLYFVISYILYILSYIWYSYIIS